MAKTPATTGGNMAVRYRHSKRPSAVGPIASTTRLTARNIGHASVGVGGSAIGVWGSRSSLPGIGVGRRTPARPPRTHDELRPQPNQGTTRLLSRGQSRRKSPQGRWSIRARWRTHQLAATSEDGDRKATLRPTKGGRDQQPQCCDHPPVVVARPRASRRRRRTQPAIDRWRRKIAPPAPPEDCSRRGGPAALQNQIRPQAARIQKARTAADSVSKNRRHGPPQSGGASEQTGHSQTINRQHPRRRLPPVENPPRYTNKWPKQ